VYAGARTALQIAGDLNRITILHRALKPGFRKCFVFIWGLTLEKQSAV